MDDKMSDRIRIVIADDHPIFLEGISCLLQQVSDYTICFRATNGNEALHYLESHSVDVLLTDINMPHLDGASLCKEVKRKYPQVMIIALTMHNDLRHITQMLKSGASGYVLKNAQKEELIHCINNVIQGKIYITQEARDQMVDEITHSTSAKQLPELSGREKEVLRLVADENTASEIAVKLFISEHTVISHRKKLMFKLGVKNTAGLIKFAMENHLLEG